jgi:hypothetical protein
MRSLTTTRPAVFSVSVPQASSITAGGHLFVNVQALCGVRPRSLKLSIHRNLRLRLHPSAARSTLSSLCWALQEPSRHTCPLSIETLKSPRNLIASLSQLSLRRSRSSASLTHTSLSEEPSVRRMRGRRVLQTTGDADSGGEGRADGLEVVEFATTVQRFSIGRPFEEGSYDGTFFVIVPERCAPSPRAPL